MQLLIGLTLVYALQHPPLPAIDSVLPNDNRVAGGSLRAGVRELHLEARLARWRPDLDVDSTVTVQTFAEVGGVPRIPGPLLRATAGTEIDVSVLNSIPDSTLVVHGLRGGAGADDTLQIAPGATRRVRFRAGRPGTYLYWGTTTGTSLVERLFRDSQLTGAIVIDPAGAAPDPAERIFVLTVLDVVPDDSVHNKAKEDIFELAINGRSWPHNERVQYSVGETVRWRWVNGSYLPHPMHLHGFHFHVLARGEKNRDTTYAAADVRLANTELTLPGSTFRMEWVPTRAGSWLMHCHITGHIIPFPERPDSTRDHGDHDVRQHPLSAMAGLVLGVTVVDRGRPTLATRAPMRRLRLFAQQARVDSGKPVARGFVLQRGSEPRPDSVTVPGSPIVLTRGQTVAITVVNRLRERTTVHWHGMELESVYDGVSGWSRTAGSVAPLIAAGDSFTVTFTPPRAGTYMYHTHIDEGAQLGTGMYGPMIVLDPGQTFDPRTDLTFMVGSAITRDTMMVALNGRREPAPMMLRVGRRYRLRFIDIHPEAGGRVQLRADSVLVWRPLAKDGADLPARFRRVQPSTLRLLGAGETYDFEWTPDRQMDALLEFRVADDTLRQVLRVRP